MFATRTVLVMCGLLMLALHRVEPSKEVMQKLTEGFSKALAECKDQLKLSDDILEEFYNYWKENYALVKREMGCAIICMATKLDMVDPDGNLHHGNAQEFAMKHGADAETAKTLVAIIHGCEKDHSAVPDDCDRVLEIAKCFRTKIHELKWAPSIEEIVEEVMQS